MLDKERKIFEQYRQEWCSKYPGKIVLIKGEELIGIFDKLEDALSEGARHFGIDSFLVRRVEETEELVYIPALTLGILRANSTHTV